MRISNLILSGVLAILFCCTETETSWATLYPDVHTKHEGQSVAANAIDGDTNIGRSGKGQILNCASTKVRSPGKTKRLQYLEIDLQRPYSISAIKLHLRDKPYNGGQNGLVVSLSNTRIETNQASIGAQCGTRYSNSTSKQSPEFTCWNSGRYVYVVLYSSYPLQVCEVQIFKVMDLISVGVATLFPPNKVYSAAGKTAIASQAIDGLSSIGNSGANGAQNCAGLQRNSRVWGNGRWVVVRMELQYLLVDIGHIQAIHSIRLHLRDGKDVAIYRFARYRDVYGMSVSVGNSSDISQSRYQCGSQYNSDTQSPTFVCESTTYARYLWMILRNSAKPFFICEVEVYADIRCTVPKNPSNGYYTITRLTHGGILSLSCKEGYRPSSNDSVVCESGGNWGKPLPTCQEITCPDISRKTVENGYLELENTTVGSSANYTCNIGFKLQSQDHRFEMTRQCVIHSKNSDIAEWDQFEPKCITDEHHCAVDNFVNGRVTYLDRKTLVFFCDTGHSLRPKGAGSLNCVNGSLSGAVPSCKIVNCGLPPELLNGNHVGEVYTYGSEVEYHCDHGYGLLGSNIFTCQANGTWNITLLPTCEPVCQRPDYGSNVGVRGLGNRKHFPVNSIVSYKCIDGYEMSDDNGRISNQGAETSPIIDSICLPTKQWSKLAPTCHRESPIIVKNKWSSSITLSSSLIAVDCGKPPNIENGQLTPDNGKTTFQSIFEYSCAKHHYLVGHNSTQCQSDGLWSGSKPECKAFCDQPKTISNGGITTSSRKSRYDAGDTVEYKCDKGYSLSSETNGQRICQNDSTWTGPNPTCQIKNCSRPTATSNGKLENTPFTYKSVAKFTCNDWFYPETTQSAVCEDNGEWNVTFESCTPFCKLSEVKDGMVLVKKNKHGLIDVGSDAVYRCNTGYFLEGKNPIRCSGRNKWSETAPTCQIVNCGEPEKPANGRVRRTSTVFESEAKYSCKNGYDLQGEKIVRCLETGKWSDRPPLCKPYCTKPPKLSNGQVAFAKGNEPQFIWVGEKVKYSCNEGNGYILEGAPNVRTCMGALSWSGPAPHCTLGDCGRPSILTNGVCTAANTKFRDTRNCKCDYGYKFYDGCLSSKQATCQVAQNVAFWPKYPNCREILCDDLRSSKTPSNVQLEYRGNKLDNIASYRCSECHVRSQGSLERTCPCNEQWTEEPLQCKKKSCRPLEKPKHGTLIGSSFECGDQVRYSCDSGYILEYGSETRTCEHTGQWTGKQPICKHACLGKCDKTRECTKDPNSGNFRCTCLKRSQCPSDFSPVCGTDGVTYNNKCLMKVSACEKNQEIYVAASGECHFGGVCTEPRPSPPNGVTCRAYLYRYWYNSTSNKCERYVFGGCFEGKNSFYTIEDCQGTCIETNVCKLPLEKGLCNRNLPRWFFNSTSNQCQSSYYSGCFGNENNFRDNQTCTKRCLSPADSSCNCLTLKRSQAVERNHKLFVVDVISNKSVDGKEAYRIKLLDACDNPKPNWFKSQREDLVVGSKDTGQNCNCKKLKTDRRYKIGVVVSKKGQVRSFYLPLQSYVKRWPMRSDTCNGNK